MYLLFFHRLIKVIFSNSHRDLIHPNFKYLIQSLHFLLFSAKKKKKKCNSYSLHVTKFCCITVSALRRKCLKVANILAVIDGWDSDIGKDADENDSDIDDEVYFRPPGIDTETSDSDDSFIPVGDRFNANAVSSPKTLSAATKTAKEKKKKPVYK